MVLFLDHFLIFLACNFLQFPGFPLNSLNTIDLMTIEVTLVLSQLRLFAIKSPSNRCEVNGSHHLWSCRAMELWIINRVQLRLLLRVAKSMNNKKLDTFFIFIQMFIFKVLLWGPKRSGRITRAPAAANICWMAKCLNIAWTGQEKGETKLKLKSGKKCYAMGGSPLSAGLGRKANNGAVRRVKTFSFGNKCSAPKAGKCVCLCVNCGCIVLHTFFRLHLKALAERMLRPTSTLWPNTKTKG